MLTSKVFPPLTVISLVDIVVLSIVPPLISTLANVEVPEAFKVVNFPEVALVAPIVVLSIAPPLISTIVCLDTPVTDKSPVISTVVNVEVFAAFKVVNFPEDAVVPPIGVLSIVPLSIVGAFIAGLVNVLFVNVSVVLRATKVSAPTGADGKLRSLPVLICSMTCILGAVNVLFFNVSVVALPTNVSVLVGNVIVPVLEILEILGAVNVLFVNVCAVSLSTVTPVSMDNVLPLLLKPLPAITWPAPENCSKFKSLVPKIIGPVDINTKPQFAN